MRLPVFTILLLASFLSFFACSTAPEQKVGYKNIDVFEVDEPLNLRVSSIKIIDSNVITSSRDDFIVAPIDILKDFLNKKLKPVGLEGALEVVVEKAALEYELKPSQSQINRLLGVGGADAYTIEVAVSLIPVSNKGVIGEGRNIKLSRKLSLSEHTSLADREAAQRDMIEKFLQDLDASVGKNLGMMNMIMPRLTFPQ